MTDTMKGLQLSIETVFDAADGGKLFQVRCIADHSAFTICPPRKDRLEAVSLRRAFEDALRSVIAAEVEASRLPLAGAAPSKKTKDEIRHLYHDNPLGAYEQGWRDRCASPAPSDAAVQPVAFYHEAWWLLEATAPPSPLYYAGPLRGRNDTRGDCTEDANKAVRFPTKDAANLTIAHMLRLDTSDPMWPLRIVNSGWKATEHIFDYTSPLPTAPAGAREAMEKALAALIELHDRCVRVKAALDVDLPDGAPVHPQSANLTWPLSTAGLAIETIRAALAAAPLDRIALSDERLLAAFELANLKDATALRMDKEGAYVETIDLIGARHAWRAFKDAARAIEAEHGITLAPIAGKGDGK